MAKTLCKTNIRKALRKSYDDGRYHSVTDSWMACFDNGRAKLWNVDTDRSVTTGRIWGCTSMTELVRYATELLMREYDDDPIARYVPKRVGSIHEATCWAEAKPFWDEVMDGGDKLEKAVLENCVWGWEGCSYSLKTLLDNEWNYGLSVERTKELWQIAYWWVAEGCMEDAA